MALTKARKEKILDELKEKMGKQKATVLVDFTGLKVKDFSNLRKQLKKAGNELKVAKKTLIDITFKKCGFDIKTKKLAGEIALIFGFKEVISPAKLVWQFAETNPNLKILGGIFENKFIETEKVIELARLPTREELLARLVGTISAPISNFVYVLQGNIKGLIYVLKQIKT